MKIYTCIASMMLAVFMLLIAPYIPHHHHDGAICVVAEHCREDACEDERHTEHSGDNSTCIEDQEYISSKSYSWQDSLTPHFFPVLVAIVNQIVLGKLYPFVQFSPRLDYAANFHSANIATGRAMRAPPTAFSL